MAPITMNAAQSDAIEMYGAVRSTLKLAAFCNLRLTCSYKSCDYSHKRAGNVHCISEVPRASHQHWECRLVLPEEAVHSHLQSE